MRSESRRSGTDLLSRVYREVSASIAALRAKKFSKPLDKYKICDIIQLQSSDNTKLIIGVVVNA